MSRARRTERITFGGLIVAATMLGLAAALALPRGSARDLAAPASRARRRGGTAIASVLPSSAPQSPSHDHAAPLRAAGMASWRRRPGRQPGASSADRAAPPSPGVSPTWPGSSSSPWHSRHCGVRWRHADESSAPRRGDRGWRQAWSSPPLCSRDTARSSTAARSSPHTPGSTCSGFCRSSSPYRVMHLAPTVAEVASGRARLPSSRSRRCWSERRSLRSGSRSGPTSSRGSVRASNSSAPWRSPCTASSSSAGGDVDDRSALAPDGGLEHHRRPAVVSSSPSPSRPDGFSSSARHRPPGRSICWPRRSVLGWLAGAGRVVDAPRPRDSPRDLARHRRSALPLGDNDWPCCSRGIVLVVAGQLTAPPRSRRSARRRASRRWSPPCC